MCVRRNSAYMTVYRYVCRSCERIQRNVSLNLTSLEMTTPAFVHVNMYHFAFHRWIALRTFRQVSFMITETWSTSPPRWSWLQLSAYESLPLLLLVSTRVHIHWLQHKIDLYTMPFVCCLLFINWVAVIEVWSFATELHYNTYIRYCTSSLTTQLEESGDWRKRTVTQHPNSWPTLWGVSATQAADLAMSLHLQSPYIWSRAGRNASTT